MVGGVRSSRQIERLIRTDVALRVMCAQEVPDHTVQGCRLGDMPRAYQPLDLAPLYSRQSTFEDRTPTMTDPNQDPVAIARWAAQTTLEWLMGHESLQGVQQPNFTVGITEGGNVIISKVGGITPQSAIIKDLQANLTTLPWYQKKSTVEVYTARAYAGNNSHGEMCVLAGSEALQDRLFYMLCSGDNCPACHDTLLGAGIISGNKPADGTQAGWTHPFAPYALGNQFTSSWENQMADLHRLNTTDRRQWDTFQSAHLQRVSTPPQGRYDRIK